MSTKPKSTKSKSPKSALKRHLKPKAKAKAEAMPAAVADPNNPYRPKSAYHVLFATSQQCLTKPALITETARLTGRSEKNISFSFSVLKARNHKSNGGRSCLIEEQDGTVRFVALQKNPTT